MISISPEMARSATAEATSSSGTPNNRRDESDLMRIIKVILGVFGFIFALIFEGIKILSNRLFGSTIEGGNSHNFEVTQSGTDDNVDFEVSRDYEGEPSTSPPSGSHYNTKISNSGKATNSRFVIKDKRKFK